MKKKILLLFSLVILCIPLSFGQSYNWTGTGLNCIDEELITSETVTAGISDFDISFLGGKMYDSRRLADGTETIAKNDLTTNFSLTFNEMTNGIIALKCYD